MVTVSTKYLEKKYKKYNDNVVTLENSMDLERWDKPKKPNNTGFLRIGWAGSLTHYDDIKMVEKPLKRIMDEFPNVQLVLVGDSRFKDLFEGYNVEVMLGVPIDFWPDKLNGLQLDIGIAPLIDNDFNRAKDVLGSGDFRTAADLFATFTQSYPGGPLTQEAHYLRGEALSQSGDTAGAARSYLEAFSGQPSGPQAAPSLLELGQALGALGQTPEACVTLQEVGTRFPGSTEAATAATSMQGLGCS
jgi:tol-pal system protein YbgF